MGGLREALRLAAGVAGSGLLLAGCGEPAAVKPAAKVEVLVPGSAFHGVHGVRFSPSGELWAGSVAGQSLYALDVATGKVRTLAGPPQGMADDIAFGPGGQAVWTAILQGVVYTRRGEGPVEVLAKDLPSINSIAFSRDGKRLFAAQVFGGDDLWELDPAGMKPPRRIRAKMGGFNSFSPGPDGRLYGPLWFKGQAISVDPDTGDVKVVAEGFKTPAAAHFDSKDNLYVLDSATGEVIRVDIRTGAKATVARLATSLDNFAVGPNDHLYVSNMADNGVQEVDPATGAVRQVVKGRLAFPADIDVVAEGGRETIHVADVFSYRTVDGATGAVTDVARMHGQGVELDYPTGISATADRVVMAGSTSGDVQVFDRASGKRLSVLTGFKGAADAVVLPGGDLLVAESGAGNLVRVAGEQRTVVAKDLKGPVGLALAPDGTVLIVEAVAGQITRLDLASGAKTPVATGLKLPKAVAVAPSGKLIVLETGARQVVEVDPKTGAKSVVAADLPLGLVTDPTPLAGGLAVGPSGTIYVSSDVDNSILKITRP